LPTAWVEASEHVNHVVDVLIFAPVLALVVTTEIHRFHVCGTPMCNLNGFIYPYPRPDFGWISASIVG